MALITDIISPDYNSFFTEAEMDAFVGAQSPFYSGDQGWSALDSATKEPYILSSVRWINGKQWEGVKNNTIVVPQMLFPRSGLTYSDGSVVPGDENPEEIGLSQACYILALLSDLVGLGSGSSANIGAIKKKTVAGVSVEFETGSSSSGSFTVETTAEDSCLQKNVPSSWYTGRTGLGVGSVGVQRLP